MSKGNRLISLLKFFVLALGITMAVVVPLIIIDSYYQIIMVWWNANSFNGLWVLLPGSIILLRWLYKSIITIKERRVINEKTSYRLNK
jgi:hypothetical protein